MEYYCRKLRVNTILFFRQFFYIVVKFDPMKTIFTRVLVLLFLCPLFSKAQELDSAFIKQRAALFADSLDKAYQNKLWDQYVSLTQPGLIKFLGGKAGVIDYAERLWLVLNQDIGEQVSTQHVLQIVSK